MQKIALIIANTEYSDPRLARLTAPAADADGVAAVLGDADIGGFHVRTLINKPQHEVQRAIVNLFAQKSRDDLLLLYFSGHGVRDDKGSLYLAATETEFGDYLEITSIPAAFITKYMDQSISRRQILILDCCYSGSFSRGMKSAATPGTAVGTGPAFEGNGFGRVVLTATDAVQFAWEGETVIGSSPSSAFTHHFIEGLRTGWADTDRDGRITVDEIYDYIYANMAVDRQTPGKWIYKQQGELLIARNVAMLRQRETRRPPRTAEHARMLAAREGREDWRHWGPYLSERAWGTVREDYSRHGNAWEYLPHDHARSRTYRWNEDGLLGICDDHQYLCFAPALWNGRDTILKERLFGLTGPEGNHGEDCKERYFYLDSTPTHSYSSASYHYPQDEFPYEELLQLNRQRDRSVPEFELADTGVLAGNRYFDFRVEYAKASENDLLIRLTLSNRASETAECVLLPTLWFRNTWSWGYADGPMGDVPSKPFLRLAETPAEGVSAAEADHPVLGTYQLYAEGPERFIFTENETNAERLWGIPNPSKFVKDAFHEYIVNGKKEAVDTAAGTKAAAIYRLRLAPGESRVVRLRLTNLAYKHPFQDFDDQMQQRVREAGAFFESLLPATATAEERLVHRRAIAGMLWTKQFYYFDVAQWLMGDPGAPVPPEGRSRGRNRDWKHIRNFGILSVPDKWEFPWYGSWDLALHSVSLALFDADYAKNQVEVLTSDSYMRLNGELPAYEWDFSDVQPPMHAWATLEVYAAEALGGDKPDAVFLERTFQRLLLNLAWWANRKDSQGLSLLSGGALGIDAIGVFDRSKPFPSGVFVEQPDSIAWMTLYALSMMKIALELARIKPDPYENWAVRFAECFVVIRNTLYDPEKFRWDDSDGFLYQTIVLAEGTRIPLKVRSFEGLIPLLCVHCLSLPDLDQLPLFTTFLKQLASRNAIQFSEQGTFLFSALDRDRISSLLRYALDEEEFLSPFGLRSLSRFHLDHPFVIGETGYQSRVKYEPGEAGTGLFGGNSNWRGPVWLSINYLIVQALRELHRFYGPLFQVACPANSQAARPLDEAARELSRRLLSLFLRDERGVRPSMAAETDLAASEKILFFEYFNGDTGRGLGASHFTGWNGLIINIIDQYCRERSS